MTWVGVAGFEPAASSSRTKRAAKLRHTPVTASAVPVQEQSRTSESLADREGRSLRPALRKTVARGDPARARAPQSARSGSVRGVHSPAQSRRPSLVAGTRVSSVAPGGQQKRTGAHGEVPRPADTCSHAR